MLTYTLWYRHPLPYVKEVIFRDGSLADVMAWLEANDDGRDLALYCYDGRNSRWIDVSLLRREFTQLQLF